MHVVLIGATGRAGSTTLTELASRGHEVTGVARHAEKLPDTVKKVTDDLTDVGRIAEIIAGADAVVSAYAPPADDPDQLLTITERLIEAAGQAGVPRLMVVGGCGSLEYEPGLLVVDSDAWPEKFVPVARSHMKTLDALRASDINWTYFSPPISITPGERTGKFRLGTDVLIKAADGSSAISFEDYAVALVDELEQPAHERARFTIGY